MIRPAKPKKFKPRGNKAGSFVYFIQRGEPGGNGPIKIGISSNPQARLVSLQSASPERLTMIGSIPGGKKLEKSLHKRFACHHIRGEWFHAHDDILNYIRGQR